MLGIRVRYQRETDEVYLALVAELSTTVVPTSIMGLTLVMVASFAWFTAGSLIYLGAAVFGGIASVGKVYLMFQQRKRGQCSVASKTEANRCEELHAIATATVSTSVGSVLAVAFLSPETDLQILATALLFGYCSGVVARISIRPNIANLALFLAATPGVVSAMQSNSFVHHILAGMFCVFLLGAFDTVRHVYQSAVRHIGSRLEMAALARNDPLTGLANRLGLREAFQAASRMQGLIALHYIDLDGFKIVNDRYGHAGGDSILVGVANRLLALSPLGTTIARYGGDEFVVLQVGLSHKMEAELLANRIVDEISKPLPLNIQLVEVKIGASLGFAVASTNCSLNELLHLADEAAYLSKRVGGGVSMACSA